VRRGRRAPDKTEFDGRLAPRCWHNLLEVPPRALACLDIRAIFFVEKRVFRLLKMKAAAIVGLCCAVVAAEQTWSGLSRWAGHAPGVLGCRFHKVVIPGGAGRNLALLGLEAAVAQTRIRGESCLE